MTSEGKLHDPVIKLEDPATRDNRPLVHFLYSLLWEIPAPKLYELADEAVTCHMNLKSSGDAMLYHAGPMIDVAKVIADSLELKK